MNGHNIVRNFLLKFLIATAQSNPMEKGSDSWDSGRHIWLDIFVAFWRFYILFGSWPTHQVGGYRFRLSCERMEIMNPWQAETGKS
jgi:hypothetical protein